MAKDFDFVRRPQTKQVITAAPTKTETVAFTEPVKQNNKPSSKDNAERRRYQTVGWAIVLLVVGTFVTLTYLYYISLQKSSSETPSNTANTEVKAETLKVTVYDRGAGASNAQAVLSIVRSLGLDVGGGATSSLDYDKSYIFYKTGELEDAQKIVAALSNYTFELRESPLPGISIYLGKN